jgi:hypothetical protein
MEGRTVGHNIESRLFEICFHFAGHRSTTQEFSAGPSEFLPDLHFLCKIVLKPMIERLHKEIELEIERV